MVPVNEHMISAEMLKDCDLKYLEGNGVEITPPTDTMDFYQMLDENKFLKAKLAEKDREISLLKEDLNRTLDQRQASQSMEIQVLRKKSKEDSKEIRKLKFQNEDLQTSLIDSMEEIDTLKKQLKGMKNEEKCSLKSLKSGRQTIPMKVLVEQQKEMISKIEQQNKILQKNNEGLLIELKSVKAELDQQTTKAADAKIEIHSLKQCKNELLQKLRSFEFSKNNKKITTKT